MESSLAVTSCANNAVIGGAMTTMMTLGIPGIGAYVLVSNRLDQKHEGEEVFYNNAQEIFERFPEVYFGIYECPVCR